MDKRDSDLKLYLRRVGEDIAGAYTGGKSEASVYGHLTAMCMGLSCTSVAPLLSKGASAGKEESIHLK